MSWGAPLRAVGACASCGTGLDPVQARVGECLPCSQGKKCSCTTPCNCKQKVVGGPWAAVGRSKPNSEIAEHEKNVQQLDKDIAAHDPGPGDTLDLANWAAINHMMNGYLLRWGQWKTAQNSDWWWGDDDESSFATLKAEYNQIRDKLIEYTKGKTTAPPAEVVSPVLVEEEKEDAEEGGAGQQLLDTLKGFLWVGFLATGFYFLAPVVLPKIAETVGNLRKR